MFGGGLVASATMQEVGFFAEFMAWLKKKPAWSIPTPMPTYPDLWAIYSASLGNLKANTPFLHMAERRKPSICLLSTLRN